jgi:hypothetical protein
MTGGDNERFDALEQQRGYIQASLRLLPTEAEGRASPIRSGYRPQWDLGHRTDDGKIAYCDAQVRLIGVEILAPGGNAEVHLHPFFPEHWEHVEAGAVLPLYEGNRRLGEARVIEMVLPERT